MHVSVETQEHLDASRLYRKCECVYIDMCSQFVRLGPVSGPARQRQAPIHNLDRARLRVSNLNTSRNHLAQKAFAKKTPVCGLSSEHLHMWEKTLFLTDAGMPSMYIADRTDILAEYNTDGNCFSHLLCSDAEQPELFLQTLHYP